MDIHHSRKISGIYLFFGFVSGLVLTVIIYILVISAHHHHFTFPFFLQLHQMHPLVYLADLLPFAGLLTGYLLARMHARLLQRIQRLNDDELDNNTFLRDAIDNLTAGNLNASLERDNFDKQVIHSLRSLQARLKKNREAAKLAREEDRQRNWTSHGLAEFGDILRSHSSDRDGLAYAVISGLVRYLDINQGGFFVISGQDDNRTLDMIACHAYDRKKFPDQQVLWGEGLIGAVAIEKKSYYTDKIPDGYLHITSGLGRANPRYLLIVPLVLNDEVFGVFELASFKPIPAYRINFVERVAENTAMTLNILYSNLRTEQLLKETQEQAAQLAVQEEKVRQNIEDLKKTQAEADLQSEQFIRFTNTVNHTLIRAEYSTDGKLIYANTRFLRKLGYSGNREVEGKHISMFIHVSDQEWFDGVWKKLAEGGAHFEGYMRHITKLGQDLWTMSTYTCVRKDDGSVEKIIFLGIDNTKQKEQSLAHEGQIRAIDILSPKAEFSPDGHLIRFNEKFLETFNYSEKEVGNKNIFDLFARSDQERFNEIWEQVIAGTAFEGQLRLLGKFEHEMWFRTTFTAISDMYGEVDRILFLAFDITKEKELEISMRSQNEKLKENEEKMKLQSLDLKKEIADMKRSQEEALSLLQRESRKHRDILTAHPLPLVSINNQGFIVLFNKAAERYWKRKAKEMLNARCKELFDAPQSDPVIAGFSDPALPVTEVSVKQTPITPKGQQKREATITIIKTASGPELIYTLLIHDR